MVDEEVNKEKDDELLGSAYMGRVMIRPEQPKRLLPQGFLTGLIFLVFVGIIWYSYPREEEKFDNADIPVVSADGSTVAEKPANPSGMEINHQDSTVFNAVDAKSAAKEENAEKILPAAEEPVDKKVTLNAAVSPFSETPRTAVIEENTGSKDAAKSVAAEKKPAATKTVAVIAPKERPIVKEVPEVASKKEAVKDIEADVPAKLKDTYIQLGSYREQADAEKDWWRIKKRYGDLLKNIEMKVVKVDLKAKGVYYRLHAGKTTALHAKNICDEINARKASSCLLVK